MIKLSGIKNSIVTDEIKHLTVLQSQQLNQQHSICKQAVTNDDVRLCFLLQVP